MSQDTQENVNHRKTGSLSKTLSLNLGLALLLGFGVLSGVILFSQAERSAEAAKQSAVVMAEMLSNQISGAVRWKKTELIDESVKDLVKSLPEHVVEVAVFVDGESIYHFAAEKQAQVGLPDYAKTLGGDLDKQEASFHKEPLHYVLTTPVFVVKKGEKVRVGTQMIAWSRAQSIAEQNQEIVTAILITLVILVAILGLLLVLLKKNALDPVSRMTMAMTKLAAGDVSIEVPGLSRNNEIGAMAQAVQVFKENQTHIKKLEAERAENEKRQEEQRRIERERVAYQLEAQVRGIVQALTGASSNLKNAAKDMSENADMTSNKSSEASSATDQASMVVETVSAASTQLSASIDEIARQVTQATTISNAAVKEADRTNHRILGLQSVVQRIGEVVTLINDIATQTNLLALNATIESARAGEAGKGFAVVANEVKNLAGQTAKATEEIATQISEIQNETRESVSAIKGISQTIDQINELAVAIASAVEEQGAATGQIANNISQVAEGNQLISASVSSVAQIASETGGKATYVSEITDLLFEQSQELESAMNGFLEDIKRGSS